MVNVENVQPALLNAFLLTTKDALMVLEAANRGICPTVSRRLHDSEKASMVKSGSVFAFDEQSTGIKRWTDGTLWSPSRIIGNYLVYRELESKGEKPPAAPSAVDPGLAEGSSSSSSSKPASPSTIPNDPFAPPTSSTDDANKKAVAAIAATRSTGPTGLQRDVERALIGSLTSSYRFKPNGLVKKTYSNGSLHLICYYTIEDVVAGRLRSPSSLMELSSLEISPRLLQTKNFRLPPLLDIDQEGIPHYAGEEADPSSTPASIEPMVSPTTVHRALPEVPAGYMASSHALSSGLPMSEYNASYAQYAGPQSRYQPPPGPIYHPSGPYPPSEQAAHEPYYSQPSHPVSQAQYQQNSYVTNPAHRPMPEQYSVRDVPLGQYRIEPARDVQHSLPSQRPYTARAAPVARTIYRPNPYDRRASDGSSLMSPVQGHQEPPRIPPSRPVYEDNGQKRSLHDPYQHLPP